MSAEKTPADVYEIECYIEEFTCDLTGANANASFTIRGADGYHVERNGKSYNEFFEKEHSNSTREGSQESDSKDSVHRSLLIPDSRIFGKDFFKDAKDKEEFFLAAYTSHKKIKLLFKEADLVTTPQQQ